MFLADGKFPTSMKEMYPICILCLLCVLVTGEHYFSRSVVKTEKKGLVFKFFFICE